MSSLFPSPLLGKAGAANNSRTGLSIPDTEMEPNLLVSDRAGVDEMMLPKTTELFQAKAAGFHISLTHQLSSHVDGLME